MHPNPIHFLILPCPPSILLTSTLKGKKKPKNHFAPPTSPPSHHHLCNCCSGPGSCGVPCNCCSGLGSCDVACNCCSGLGSCSVPCNCYSSLEGCIMSCNCYSSLGGCSVPCSRPFCPNSFSYKCPLQWIVGLVQGLWLLLHHHSWTLVENPLGNPADAPVMETLSL